MRTARHLPNSHQLRREQKRDFTGDDIVTPYGSMDPGKQVDWHRDSQRFPLSTRPAYYWTADHPRLPGPIAGQRPFIGHRTARIGLGAAIVAARATGRGRDPYPRRRRCSIQPRRNRDDRPCPW